MNAGHFVVLGLMLATLAVMVLGVVLMTVGGDANKKFGAKLMMMRVVLQGAALLALVVLFATK